MSNLKMSPESFDVLRKAVAVLDTEYQRGIYRRGEFSRASTVKDLNKRYRWDLAYAAVGTRWLSELYTHGLNDTHIDSALRAIVAPL